MHSYTAKGTRAEWGELLCCVVKKTSAQPWLAGSLIISLATWFLIYWIFSSSCSQCRLFICWFSLLLVVGLFVLCFFICFICWCFLCLSFLSSFSCLSFISFHCLPNKLFLCTFLVLFIIYWLVNCVRNWSCNQIRNKTLVTEFITGHIFYTITFSPVFFLTQCPGFEAKFNISLRPFTPQSLSKFSLHVLLQPFSHVTKFNNKSLIADFNTEPTPQSLSQFSFHVFLWTLVPWWISVTNLCY